MTYSLHIIRIDGFKNHQRVRVVQLVMKVQSAASKSAIFHVHSVRTVFHEVTLAFDFFDIANVLVGTISLTILDSKLANIGGL